jgi:hypothetical protein
MIREHLSACSMVVLAALSIESCAVQRALTSAEVTTPPPGADAYSRFATSQGQQVAGYVTRDGVKHALHGRARLQGDTLVFHSEARSAGMGRPVAARTERVALSDLQSVQSETIDPLRSMLFATSLVLVSGLIYVGGSMAADTGGAWLGF